MAQTKIESYNSHMAHSVKSLFPPSWVEAVIYFLSALVLLGILNYRAFTNNLGTRSGVDQTTLNSYLHDKLANSTDFISRLLQGRIASILFWAFLGSFIYMIIWIVQNLIVNIENDVEAGKFKGLESAEKKQAYWHSVISSKIFFGCAVLVSIIYLVALINFFLPVASRSFGLAVTDYHPLKSFFSIIVSTFFTALLLYILILTIRAVNRAWHWIIGNF